MVAPTPSPADATDEEPAEAEAVEPEPEMMHGAIVDRSSGQVVLHAEAASLLAVVSALRSEGYWQCIDVCGVDYLTHPGRSGLPATVTPQRFEVVVSLLNHSSGERVRIRVQVPETDPVVPSLFSVHPGSEAMEREAFDLFGIVFDGHPNLTRILLPDEWVGHPLRKDYAVGRIPVQFKAAPGTR